MSDGNTLDDVLHFGKHKGAPIRQVLKVDPTYLAWLRDKTADDMRQSFFDKETNDLIDDALRKMKRSRQRIWSDNPPPHLADALKAQAEALEAAREREEEEQQALAAQAAMRAAQARDMAYAQEWGAW
ncbi:hypothetical protein C0Q88_07340 [Ralstonia pickettii]|uniref:Exodeoxyribonuclease X-like C-terminal domain-containing protein n=1 Tax=Ralstonia pickettii TaxID=329 RepID=A0A2N4TXN9_RALPI|nr:hypothetical protein [Ralstonia pickettii]PLC44484.1 hypothetical protein C0Q88_07340 [Ralstonia pickettii]